MEKNHVKSTLKDLTYATIISAAFLFNGCSKNFNGKIVEKEYIPGIDSTDAYAILRLKVETDNGLKKFGIYGEKERTKKIVELADSLYIGREVNIDIGEESSFKTNYDISANQVTYK